MNEKKHESGKVCIVVDRRSRNMVSWHERRGGGVCWTVKMSTSLIKYTHECKRSEKQEERLVVRNLDHICSADPELEFRMGQNRNFCWRWGTKYEHHGHVQ